MRKEVIDEIRKEISRLVNYQPIIIVEGKKDIRCLHKFGLTNVREIKGPLFSFAESVASETKDVVILTDLDTEGRKLYSELVKNLSRLGVRIDSRLREILFGSPVAHIEGLYSYLESHD